MRNVEQIVVAQGALQRENAAIGVFITLELASRDMIAAAISAGF